MTDPPTAPDTLPKYFAKGMTDDDNYPSPGLDPDGTLSEEDGDVTEE